MKSDYTDPIPVKRGDIRLLLNGRPPLVDCRVISEDNYQYLIDSHNKLLDALTAIRDGVKLHGGLNRASCQTIAMIAIDKTT